MTHTNGLLATPGRFTTQTMRPYVADKLNSSHYESGAQKSWQMQATREVLDCCQAAAAPEGKHETLQYYARL
jgi:hypothetical protein